MISSDRRKRTEFAEHTLWNGIAYFKRKQNFIRPNPLISLYFTLTLTLILLIAANAANLTLLIAAYAVSTCDRGIFLLRKSIAMTLFSLTIFRHFYFRQFFPIVWDLFRYMTHAHTLCKWAGACRNRPRTPESQHAWYDLMLGQRWLRWLGNKSTINTAMTAACALMRGWIGLHFFHRRLIY